MISDYVRVFLIAWLLLALISDWPAWPAPVSFRQILRCVVEIVALIIIAFYPAIVAHWRS